MTNPKITGRTEQGDPTYFGHTDDETACTTRGCKRAHATIITVER